MYFSIFLALIIASTSNPAISLCYSFDDGKIPPEIASSSEGFQLLNGVLQIGFDEIYSEVILHFDQKADISFKWKSDYSAHDLGRFRFIGPDLMRYNCTRNDFASMSFSSLPPGNIKFNVIKCNECKFGYLDDLCIQYRGSNVTIFSISPHESSDYKKIYAEIISENEVTNSHVELLIPDAAEISECVLSGFLEGSKIYQGNGMLVLDRSNVSNASKIKLGSIKILVDKFPEGKHFIKINELNINDVGQHPSLLGCIWELNTADGTTTAETFEG
jgi:hypothetical protein